jgi:hypothetical protein
LSPEAKRVFQINLLLAVVTGVSLAALVAAATYAAPPGHEKRFVYLAPATVLVYLLVSRFLARAAAPRPPLIQPGAPVTMWMALILPLIIIACAVAAMIWPGQDFGVLVIMGAVWFGLTIDSAVRARKYTA